MSRTKLAAGAGLAVVAVILVIGVRSFNDSRVAGGDGVVIIKTGAEMTQRQQELKVLTEEVLIKHAVGDSLTEEDFKKLDRALPIARGIVGYNPTSYTAHLVVGQILLAQGERDKALNSMLQCLAVAPNQSNWGDADKFIVAETLNDIGSIYYGKSMDKEAESYVREALLIYPENIKFLTNLAQIEIHMNRLDEARVTLNRIRKIKPDSEALAALEGLIKPKPN